MEEKPNKIRVALIAGALIGVVSGVPGLNLVNCCCCAGVVMGGLLATYLYLKEFTPQMPSLESSDALILGIFTGVAGACSVTVVELLIRLLFGGIGDEFAMSFMEQLIGWMEESANVPPEVVDEMRNQVQQSLEGSDSFFGVLSGLFITLILYPIFATLGAMLGYAIFKPKQPQTTQTT
ncbi:MAG: hypothetical protein FJ215_05965 [Ignavibacteria bacterium]|nr:hypothetical protein [Ignavibacteria bacterium]